MLKRNFLLLFLFVLPGVALLAQDPQRPVPNVANIPDDRMEQHDKWLTREESFPAKERHMWQVGLNLGMLRVSGDVRSEWGTGYGISVRKGLGYIVSLRGRVNKGTAYGINWYPSSGIDKNPALNGVYQNAPNYTKNPGFVYHNFQMEMYDGGLDALFNVTNFNFHNRQNVISIYGLAGIGALLYDVNINQLDENGLMYEYQKMPFLTNDREHKKAQEAALKDMLDDTYETQGEFDRNNMRWNDYAIKPVLSLGAGLGFRISRRVEVGLEHRINLVDDDLLDGQRWGEDNTLSPNNDVYHYTSFNLGFNLGKNAEEPEWWVNPLEYTYDYLAYLDDNLSMEDSDNDGVIDKLDEEPDTPEGAVVDTKGRTMDSDGDGCPDHEDPEPFSSPEFPIVDCVTQWPKGVTEERVIELIKEHSLSSWYLPMIHFDTDKSAIKPEFVDELASIADIMQANQSLTLDVTGHADHRYTEEYNLALSQRRAESAVNYLVENFGIDRNRFNIHYEGETDPLIENARTSTELYMNRRVEFSGATR